MKRAAGVVLVIVLSASALFAVERPLAVSPGGDGSVGTVEGRCPTFSWAAREHARSWRLAVYRVPEQVGEEPGAGPLVLSQRLPAAVSSWTPSLERCLARGGTYAWSIGAEGAKGRVTWSEPRLFRVPERAAQVTLEEALAVVRRHLEENPGGEVATDAPAARPAPAAPEPAVGAPTRRTGGPATAGIGPSAPLAGTVLQLDGNLQLTRGDTPSLRLEQDGSGSFTPQTWDIRANENAFSVSNVSGGGFAPFVIDVAAGSATLQVTAAGVTVSGSVGATSFQGDGGGLTGVTASGLVCTNCVGGSDLAGNSVGASHIVQNAVGSSEIAQDAVGSSEIAEDAVAASEIADGAIGLDQLGSVFVYNVECDGECDDGTLADVCGVNPSRQPARPIAVICSQVQDSFATPSSCGGDNVCSNGFFVSGAATLDSFCDDVSGHDALVFCLLEGQ